MRLLPILVVALMVGLILPLFMTLGNAEYTTPIVWSNKKEYYPSETACLYGYGFKVLAQINITIIRPDLVEDKIQTSTDEFGYFVCQYLLDGIHGTFMVTATDGVNVATTTFDNALYLNAWWSDGDSTYIYAEAGGLSKSKQYYIKYFDPGGVERRKSPTYTGVSYIKDNLTILPSFPNILGYWTVRLYENDAVKRTKTLCIDRIVWTTDSTFVNLVTSFAQGETVYFKTIGLQTNKYYRFKLEMPNGTRFFVGSWTTGVTSMTGSYVLPSNAPIGSWKLHVRQATDASGTCETHYVDCCFQVTTAPPPTQYYLTVQTDPTGIGTIPGQGWYNACTYVNLTAPESFPGSTGIRYRFNYWDVDGASQGIDVRVISVYMNAAHTATAHYVTQYFLNLTANPLGVTTPAGVGWYDAGTNVPIFAPEFISIVSGASRYRFNGWTTGDMSEIANVSATSTTVFLDKPKTVTANYVTQYHLTVVSPYGTPTGDGWYDSGTTAYAMLDTNIVNHGNGTRRVFTSWSGDASGTNYAQSNAIVMNAAKTAISNWKTEYQLTVRTNGLGTYITNVYNVTTVLGTATDATPYTGWFNQGSLILLNMDTPIVDGSKRFVFTHWSGDISGTEPQPPVTMNTAKDITINYKTQYEITVTASPVGAIGGTFKVTYTSCGTVFANVVKTTSWTDWADASTTVTVSEPQDTIDISLGARYKFDYYNPSATVTMDQSKTITLVYKTQYYLTVFSSYGSPTPASGWFDSGANITASVTSPVSGPTGTQYVCTGWSGTGNVPPSGSSSSVNFIINQPSNITWNWKTQYFLTVTSPYGTTGGQGWYDSGATAYASLNSGTFDHGNGTRRLFTQWGGDASGMNYAQSNQIIMSAPKTAIANWKTQHLLTVVTDPSGLTPQPTRNPAGEAGPANGWWYDASTSVTLTAQPVTGYPFNRWDVDGSLKTVGENPISVSMNTPHTATAHYTQAITYTLAVTATASGATNPAQGTYTYSGGITVDVTATPSAGYRFDHWVLDGSNAGTVNHISVLMDKNHNLQAVFAETHTLTISVSQGGTTNPAVGTYTYQTPTDVSVTAIPNVNYQFDHWIYDNNDMGSQNPITVHVGSSHTLRAVFVEVTPPVGGYSMSLVKQTPTSPIAAYTMLIALFGAVLSLIKRKRK